MNTEAAPSEEKTTSEQTDTPIYTPPEPAFGWSPYAELINGRFAMIGFIALLILEWFTKQDFFTWLGLR